MKLILEKVVKVKDYYVATGWDFAGDMLFRKGKTMKEAYGKLIKAAKKNG